MIAQGFLVGKSGMGYTPVLQLTGNLSEYSLSDHNLVARLSLARGWLL
jgi:hypothetical protein